MSDVSEPFDQIGTAPNIFSRWYMLGSAGPNPMPGPSVQKAPHGQNPAAPSVAAGALIRGRLSAVFGTPCLCNRVAARARTQCGSGPLCPPPELTHAVLTPVEQLRRDESRHHPRQAA